MSLLRELEQRLEALFEGFFTRQFKSGVQPVEIAKKLTRAMDSNRTISVSKVYVPNRYTILVSDEDEEKLRLFKATLVSELQGFLVAHAKREGYELVGRPRIELAARPELALGELAIECNLESAPAGMQEPTEGARIMVAPEPLRAPKPASRAARAYLVRGEAGHETRFLLEGSTGIGRAPDNDVVIPDPNVSRHHARIEVGASGHVLKDLGSTNGTLVNGKRVGEHALTEGDAIVIGTTKFTYRGERGV